jgi:hypothetical protein
MVGIWVVAILLINIIQVDEGTTIFIPNYEIELEEPKYWRVRWGYTDLPILT